MHKILTLFSLMPNISKVSMALLAPSDQKTGRSTRANSGSSEDVHKAVFGPEAVPFPVFFVIQEKNNPYCVCFHYIDGLKTVHICSETFICVSTLIFR